MFHCNGSRHNKSGYCYVSSDENDACFTAVEVGITISISCYVSVDENEAMEAGITKIITADDENNAFFTAMEAGLRRVITATYPMMKIMRVSLQ